MAPCKCPICGYVFSYGILGWDSHIARVENHPTWHPRVVVREARLRTFQREFLSFFNLAKTSYRRKKETAA